MSGSSEFALLRPGAGVQLSRGLATSAGPQALSLPGEVVSVERIVGQSKHVVVSVAARSTARSHNWNGDVPVRASSRCCALAGVRLDTAGAVSSQSARQPALITGPNESGREIARRLLDLAPERCRPVEALLALTDPRSQPSPYAYGYSGHPLYSGTCGTAPWTPTTCRCTAGRAEARSTATRSTPTRRRASATEC
ncbi:MAG: hypothetical protein WKH64_16735 [Chloroflexia bacterium]